MGKFDSIKQALSGDAATVDPDYAQTPQDPKSTSLTNRLLEGKARIRDAKVAQAREVFAHKNPAPVAEQKAYIQSPDNIVNPFEGLPSVDLPDALTEEDMLRPTPELGRQLDPASIDLFDAQLEEDLAVKEDEVFTDLNDAADRYEVPKNLLQALAKQESNFDNTAVSQTGVRGVLQVTEVTGEEMFKGTGVTFDVTNQDHQIEAGAKYLAKHIKDWKAKGFSDQQSQHLATASYNTGFSRISDAIAATKKKNPTMQEIEDAGLILFKGMPAKGKVVPLDSFKEGMAHWKKIHYQDGELQNYTDDVVTAGNIPTKPVVDRNQKDFQSLQEMEQMFGISPSGPTLTPTDVSTPGGLAKKIQQGDIKALKDKVQNKVPAVPMDVPQEWDNLFDTIVDKQDIYLMGLSEGTESLKIASKDFMKSKGVTGLTSPQAIKYLNDNVTELTEWIKNTSGKPDQPIDSGETTPNTPLALEPEEVPDKSPDKAKIVSEETKPVNVPAIQEQDTNRVADQLKPTKIEDTERPTPDIEKPVSKSKDVRIIEEEPIIDELSAGVETLSTEDIYELGKQSYNPMSDLDQMSEQIVGLTDKEIEDRLSTAAGMAPLESTSKVVEQFSNNVFKHADNTWTVIAQDGTQLLLKDEIIAKSYAAYDEANTSANPDAPTSALGQYANQIMASLAMPVETIASAFAQTPESIAAIKQMAKDYVNYFPVNRKHMAGASVALSLISEQKGSVEAVKYAFDNIGVFLEKGFDSVGFTLALAIGNVPVQIGMLTSLSIGKGKKMKEEWKALPENKGKELTPEIAARIEISAAFSMLAEKVSVSALKGVVSGKPLVKVDPTKWMNKVGDAINRGINKNLGTKTANLLLVKPITKIAAPLGGEGAQEVVSQAFETYGLKEEFLSKSEMVAIGIEGTLAAPGVGATVVGLKVSKEVAKKLTGPSQATKRRVFLETALEDTQSQLSKITIEDRINDLDQQIADLSGEVTDTPTGVASENVRFNEIYDTLRAEAFGQLSIPDAIAAAKEQLAAELKSLTSEKAQLEKDTEPLKFKDNELLSRDIRKNLALIEQQIETLKNTPSTATESETEYRAKLETLENKKKGFEDKLNSRVNKQQLEYLREQLTAAKTKLETALKNPKQTSSILEGDSTAGTKLESGEQTIILTKIMDLAETKDPGLLDPDNELDPINLEATSDYSAPDNSGLEVVKETEGGAVTSNTVQLKEEPTEWTDEKTGRRLTEKDFDSPIEYQQFVKKTREFDANRERGIAELKKIRSEKIEELTPEDINPRRQQLILKELGALANRDLNEEEKQVVREKVAELKEKGVLPTDGGKKDSQADKLFSGPTAFADAQNATPEQLKEAINDPKTDAATKKHLRAIAKAQRDQKIIEKKLEGKDFADVHEEIVSGEGKKFKGLHAYRDEIIDLFRNPEKLSKTLKEQKIRVAYEAMSTHALNLSNKLTAFKSAYKSAESGFLDPGNLWTVSGVIDPDAKKINPNTRKMKYTVSKMTREAYEAEVEERRGTDGTSFLTEISSSKQTDTTLNSANLINALQEEVNLGRSAWEAVKTYSETSIAKNELRAENKKLKDSEFLASLDKIEEQLGKAPVAPITDEQIANIKDPLKDPQKKTETATPEAKEQPKGTSIQDEIAKLKEDLKRVRQLKAEKAKKDTLGSAPDENYDEQEQEILRKIEELEALERQAGQQFTEDEAFNESDPVSDETIETSKSPTDSTEQDAGSAEKTTGESRTKAGKIQDFITSSIKKYWPVVREAGVSSKDRMMGMLGTFFTDLVQIGEIEDIQNIPGLHTLKDTDFIFEESDTTDSKLLGTFSGVKLYNALKGLGVDKTTAKHIAQGYKIFKKRYDRIAATGKFKGNFALREPLSILLSNDDNTETSLGKLPDQVLLGMYLGALAFKTKNPTNTRFHSDWEKKQFLYSGKEEPTANEVLELKDLGHAFNEAADSVGKDVATSLKMSAKQIAKDHPTLTQASADLYYARLLPALGLMAIDIVAGKDSEAWFSIENKIWNFEGPPKKQRNFNNRVDENDKEVYRHIKYPENNKPNLADKLAIEKVTEQLGMKLESYGEILREPVDTPTRIKRSLKKVPRKVRKALEKLHNAKWNVSETADSVAVLNENHKDILNRLIGILPTEGAKVKIVPGTTNTKKYAKDNPNTAVYTMRVDEKDSIPHVNSNQHFGNPWSATFFEGTKFNTAGSIEKAVSNYREWLAGRAHQDVEPERRAWILKKINEGFLNNKQLVYFKAGYKSHADVLVEFVPAAMHQRTRDSNEAANRDKENDLSSFLKANKEGELKDFYFSYELQGHHRILQQGKINPQNSKVTRFLLQSWGAQTYNKTNLWKFKLAVAQNFGLDVDKNNLAYAETQFDHIINNGHVQKAVKAMQALKENKDNKQAANKLAEALSEIKSINDYKDANIQLLTAVTALANYMPSGDPVRAKSEFKSDIVMEIDGITNGFAMNLLQFPMFKDDQLEMHLNQTGTYYDVRSAHDPSKPDVYMSLIQHIKTGATTNKAVAWYSENAWKDDFIKDVDVKGKYSTEKNISPDQQTINDNIETAYKALYVKRATALKQLVPDLHLYDKGMRKTVKYPFMIYMYGGGAKSIAQGVASDVVDGLYEQAAALHIMHQDMQNNRLSPEAREHLTKLKVFTPGEFKEKVIGEFVDNLEKLGAFEGKLDINKKVNPKDAKEKYKAALIAGKALDTKDGKAVHNFNDTELITVIGRTVEPRFTYGLESMLGSTKEARSDVIKMGQMMHQMFMLKYETAYQKKLNEINDEYEASLSEENRKNFNPLDRLTDQQIREMVSGVNAELSEIVPQAAGPLAQILKDKNGKEYTDGALDLSSIESVRTTEKKDNKKSKEPWDNEKIELRSDRIETRMTPSKKGDPDNRPANRTIMAKQLQFVESGVSVLIRQIQNMDSVILTQTFGGGNGKGDPRVNIGFTDNKWEGDGNVLPLHDAFMASPEQLSMISEIYGTTYIEYNKKYSIMETTFKQVEKIRNILTDEQAYKLNRMYEADDILMGREKPRNADYFIKGFKNQTNVVTKAREKLFAEMKKRGVVSHQLYMPRPEGEQSTETILENTKRTVIAPAISNEEPTPQGERPTWKRDGKTVQANDDQWRAMGKMSTWWSSDMNDRNNRIFVLQGRGGTGKTTIVDAALTELKVQPGQVKFALPTHKAKQVIRRAAGNKYSDEDFDTIAGLLGQKPKTLPIRKNGKETGEYYKAFKKDQTAADDQKDGLGGVKVIVIDEASMVNESQTSQLIELADELRIRLLFMGDNVQLPPIEKKGAGNLDVARVFDTVMDINQKEQVPINIKAHYAKLNQRMRQDAGNPILGVTDILANVAEWIHKRHTEYQKIKTNSQLHFELPFINDKNVKYMDGTANGATDATITAFANDYNEARQNKNEQNVKYIHYNATGNPQSIALRTRIRKAIFKEADPGVNEKPFLKGERLILDKSITVLDGSFVKGFSKELHNGDEVTVVEELTSNDSNTTASYTDGKGNRAITYDGIPINILKVKLDGDPNVHILVLPHPNAGKILKAKMIKAGRYNVEKEENRITMDMFTTDIGAAYIINSHKAQGSTYDTVYADYENIMRGAHGADFLTRVKSLYVATSRPRTKLVMVGDSVGGLNLGFGTGTRNDSNKELFAANQAITDSIGEMPELEDFIQEQTDQIKSDAPVDTPTSSWEDLESFLDSGLTDEEQSAIYNLSVLSGEETVLGYINNPKSLQLEIRLIEDQNKENEALAEADEEFGMDEDGGTDESAIINKGIIVLHEVLVNRRDADTLKSMDDLPKKPTGRPVDELGAIDGNNFKKLFTTLKALSTQYYANTKDMFSHSETLDTVLDILGEGITEIGGIPLTLQEITGITQGKYDIANKTMEVSLSNSNPYDVNQSPQEVYVHELLHSTTALAIRENPLLANRVDRVYLQTKRALDAKYGKGSGYKVFLAGITSPSANDITMAKKQYNYVFAGREKNRLHEFLAFAATNRQMIDFLKTQPRPVREGILDNILGIITDVMNFLKQSFGARTYAAKSDNAFAEILAATEHLVATQAKHESMAARLNAYTYNNLDKSDEFLKKLGEDVALKIKGSGKNQGPLRQAAVIVSGGLFNIMSTNEGTIRARQMIDQALNKTMRGIANEIGDGALTKEMIEQLLYVKVNISKARQQAETFTMSWFNGHKEEGITGIWKSVKEDDKHGLDVKTKVALTRVLFQTDLSVLLNEGSELGMTPAEIMDLIGHKGKARRNTLKARIARELKLSHKSDALSYSKELGHFIATGNTRLDDSHNNVSTIAAQFLTNPTTQEINLLDMYATLSALDYTDATHNEAVLKLARAEFKADPERNGISDLLKSHHTYKQNIRADNFEENELQLMKGYIVERVDNFTSIRIDRADRVKEMKQMGYSESYKLAKIDGKQTYDTMYVTRTTPEVTDVSGVMSTTNQRNMGTTLTEILVRDPAYHYDKGPNKGKPNFHLIEVKVKRFIKEKNRSAKANKDFAWDTDLTMRPLRDQAGNITDYRVMMNHADVEQIIRPDLQIDHVFAHMRSSAVDRKATIESDKKTVELLVYEQQDLKEATPEAEWINIMDPNSPYIDRFRKLPKAVREHMKEYAKGGQFFIREDIIDKVFGYKSFDLSELKMLQDESTATKRISKRVAGITHHAIKQTVGYGKNRVVIAMPKVVIGNMMSNIYQLMMRKIPLDYIFHKIYEGVHEYNKYRIDTERRVRIKHEIESQNLNRDTSPEAVEMRELDDRIEGNLIHRLSKAGLNSLIVEDINDAQADGWLNKLQKTIPYSFPEAQKYIDKIPSELGDAARFIFMTKGSKPYQISRHIVQMTDFLARYVMIEHATKVKGQGFNEAVHESLDAFVVFDEALVPALETLEAVGATSFLSYYLRNARSSRKLAASSPTSVALSAAIQHTTGIPTLGNVNSSWLAGRFSPNMLQTDDLFDEANNITLFDVIKNEGRDLFN